MHLSQVPHYRKHYAHPAVQLWRLESVVFEEASAENENVVGTAEIASAGSMRRHNSSLLVSTRRKSSRQRRRPKAGKYSLNWIMRWLPTPCGISS